MNENYVFEWFITASYLEWHLENAPKEESDQDVANIYNLICGIRWSVKLVSKLNKKIIKK